MPRRKPEFGMETFGTESTDAIAPAVVEQGQQESTESATNAQQGENGQSATQYPQDGSTTNINVSTATVENGGSAQPTQNEQRPTQHMQQPQQSVPSPGVLSLYALQYANSSYFRRDPSLMGLRTPSTPATPGSTGLATSHSAQTSYFPATPASGNTIATRSMFGGCPKHHYNPHFEETAINSGLDSSEQSSSPIFKNLGHYTSDVPEMKRQRHIRSEILPTIITNSSSQGPHRHPSSQISSALQTPAIFGQCSDHQAFAAAAAGSGSGSYPTPVTSAATPRSPNSMSEWRMMQMQLQQQDEVYFSLALPSVSTMSLNTLSSHMSSSYSTSALTPIAVGGGTVTASACSCCDCNSNNSSPPSTRICIAQSPVSATPTFGAQVSGLDSVTQHHSILLPTSSSRSYLSATESSKVNGSKRQSWIGGSIHQYRQNYSFHQAQMHSHCSASTISGGCLSNQDACAQGTPHGHGLGLVQAPLATFRFEYAPSLVDPSEFEHSSQHNTLYHRHGGSGIDNYGSSPAGTKAPMSQFESHSYLLSAPTSAIGYHTRSKTKDCGNCLQYCWHRFMTEAGALTAGALTAGAQAPALATLATPETVTLGGVEIGVSISNM
ncbi:hypothetical protein BC939DRAFT_534133, partial [Gamsiella multidivaricata]|uniref:uncharacterized protein n=2 Tax=Gamsiella multidivaricata TaxID=101098 RepID=UPI002220A5AA